MIQLWPRQSADVIEMATLRLKYSPEAVVPMTQKTNKTTRHASIRAGSRLVVLLPGDLDRRRGRFLLRRGGLVLS